MRILIAGNMGYVGPSLIQFLRRTRPNAELIGFDAGFFGQALTDANVLPETLLDCQVFGDIREIPETLLNGVDAIVHLAAISNDPMGNRFERVTGEVNQAASVRLACQASRAGVKSFIFASSCSVYGTADAGARTEADRTDPITAYAQSKVGTENALRAAKLDPMVVTSLRFATACGMSDRLRLDLVLNDFVACALTSGEITVLSDGSPWRPLIDVEDMARAIDWAIDRPSERGGPFLVINVGHNEGNYQVKDLAAAVEAAIPGTKVSINSAAPADRRSYRVDFSLFKMLAPDHTPQIKLEQSICKLRDGLQNMSFADRDFRNSQFIRLKMLERHIGEGRLSHDLRWNSASWILGSIPVMSRMRAAS